MTAGQKIILFVLLALNGLLVLWLQQPLEMSILKALALVFGSADITIAFVMVIRHI